MFTLKEVAISGEQLDEFKPALVEVKQEMKDATRYGDKAKEIYTICMDAIIAQENDKRMEMTKMGGDLAVSWLFYAAHTVPAIDKELPTS